MGYFDEEKTAETGYMAIKPVGRVEGTINFFWALFLGFMSWPLLVFYNDGFIAWVLEVVWLFILGYLCFLWRRARNARRRQQMEEQGYQ